jgi:hypothetical protein
MISSKPLWREPAGASSESVCVRSIESLETPGPRRRFDAPSSPLFALRLIRRLLHAGRFLRRTRRQTLEPRDLVLQRLDLDPLPRLDPVAPLDFRLQPLQFAKQSANQADQLGRRHPFNRIASARRHAPA